MMRAALLLLLALAGCSSPCSMLAERLCACDQANAANLRACESARAPGDRAKAEQLARQTGVDPQRVCREALRRFRCPNEPPAP